MAEPIPISITIYRANGLRWHPPESWIRPHRLYVRVDSGTSDNSRKTKKIRGTGTAFEWNEEISYNADDTIYISLRSRTFIGTRIIIGAAEVKREDLLEGQGAEIHVPLTTKKSKFGNPTLTIKGAKIRKGADLGVMIENGIESLTETLKSIVDTVFDKIDTLAELHPYANIAWKAFSALYRVIKAQRIIDQNIHTLIETMNKTLSFAKNLEELAMKENIGTIKNIINQILQQTAECAFFIREYSSRRFLIRELDRALEQLWKDPNSKIEDFTEAFKRLRNDLDTGTVQRNTIVLSGMSKQIDILVQAEVLRPSRMDASKRKPCLPGTRKQILARIIDWAVRNDKDNEFKNVLWLHGMAGSGKSTIATSITDYFRTLGRQGAYLFFERATGDPSSLIRTLAYRLAGLDQNINSAISQAIAADRFIADGPLNHQFEQLLRIPLTAAVDTLTGPIIIVLDALDECGSSAIRGELLEILGTKLSTLPPIFRFLITSRPESDIRFRLGSSNSVMSLESEVKDEEALSDIRTYLHRQLGIVRGEKGLPANWPPEDQIMLLVENSDRLFIWAFTICELIGKASVPDIQLNTLVYTERGRKIRGLDSLYATALEISYSDTDSDATADTWSAFRSVMSVVLFSGIKIYRETVDHILDIPTNRSKAILSHFSPLLDYREHHPIRPVHASFRDYLVDEKRSGGRPWSLSSISPERDLANLCFRIMEGQLRFNICTITTSHLADDDYFIGPNTKDAISIELKYACQSWAKHLRAVGELDDTLVDLLKVFSNQNFLFWLEVMSISGLWSEVLDACRLAGDVVKGKHQGLENFWADAYTFVRDCPGGCTSHIYISALPLTPPTSRISQIYLPRFSKTVKLVFQQTDSPPDHPQLTGSLSYLCFSPDDTMLISCFGEGIVHIRSTQDYSLIPQYQACYHQDGIRVAKFSHDNQLLYCLTKQNSLVSWEAATRKFSDIYPTGISDIVIYDDKIVISCEDGNLKIWAGKNSVPTETDNIYLGYESLGSLSVSAYGLIAVSQAESVHLVDITSREIIKTFTCEDSITSLSFSDASNLLAASMESFDSTLSLYSEKSGWKTITLKKRDSATSCGMDIAWLNGNSIICIGWDNNTVSLWDVETCRIIFGPLYHGDGHCQVAISSDGKTLATGTAEECIKIWDVGTLLSQNVQADNLRPFNGCEYEGNWIIGSSGEQLIKIPASKLPLISHFALKHTTMMNWLDFSGFVHGTQWAECYSGNEGLGSVLVN